MASRYRIYLVQASADLSDTSAYTALTTVEVPDRGDEVEVPWDLLTSKVKALCPAIDLTGGGDGDQDSVWLFSRGMIQAVYFSFEDDKDHYHKR